MMHQLISKKIIIYLFVFLSLVTVNSSSISKLFLPSINEIKISGLDLKENNKIENIIKNSKYKNLFYIEKLDLIKKIKSLKTVESVKIFKNYPSTLIVDIKKVNFLAVTKKDGLNYFIGSNGKLIKNNESTSNLPFVFGNLNIKEFLKLKNKVDRSDFKFNEILNFYFYKSNRWDIETSKGYLVKLPKDNIENSLNLIVRLLKEKKFEKKSIIDLRQKNQIILNEK